MTDGTCDSEHVADRLVDAVRAFNAPACVGIDPVLERLPEDLGVPPERRADVACVVDAIEQFCTGVLDVVAPVVPCVKFQSACFERYGWRGVRTLERLVTHARQRELITILDAKRGDIGISAAHYAAASFEVPGMGADWLTINPYLGADAMTPFIGRTNHGAFALVRTSNPESDRLQGARLEDGREVAHLVASMVAEVGGGVVGSSGFSNLGAVVGATKPEAAQRLRAQMPRQFFLVPGFGAQGAGIDDIKPCFRRDGLGAIVTASRSVIYAFENSQRQWRDAVREAAALFADAIGHAAGLR